MRTGSGGRGGDWGGAICATKVAQAYMESETVA